MNTERETIGAEIERRRGEAKARAAALGKWTAELEAAAEEHCRAVADYLVSEGAEAHHVTPAAVTASPGRLRTVDYGTPLGGLLVRRGDGSYRVALAYAPSAERQSVRPIWMPMTGEATEAAFEDGAVTSLAVTSLMADFAAKADVATSRGLRDWITDFAARN